MDHIEIYVSDLMKTKDFYEFLLVDNLSFEIYQEWSEGISYKKNGFYIVFVQSKNLDEKYNRTNIGLNHLALNIDSHVQLDVLRDRCIEENIVLLYDEKYPYAGGKDHYALFFEDPDRIKIEIVVI
ncbi:hypothetical protein BG261_01640 [Floricoccus tropicus]|uniref:VOC domain-containing protein n=1 Tax=Floricoccus tropicus TaxID=1859473 RepID=A0A1E8GM48_9LACT|nr:VOC family protein [Floricoccus tropicus]OFI49310.1 hypothetical protein BG261_01640 [Floricoccus tropicus]